MSIVLDGTTGITAPAVDAGNMVGEVCFFAMSTAPSGFLKANGATISRTTYAALFTAIGTTFGSGDGSTTFVLPDLRGEFARGWDDGRGVDAGRAFGSAQTDTFKSHNHTMGDGGTTFSAVGDGAGGPYGSIGRSGGGSSRSVEFRNTGDAETRPRNVALLACIKF